MKKSTIAVILGNRNFFPDHLITGARKDILTIFNQMNIEPVILDESQTKLGSVETWAHAKQCADLFKKHSDQIDGILVCLPNFGDEKGIADAIKLSGLRVPILVQAYPDEMGKMNLECRRDSFCGKISACNNLRQYGFPFSLTTQHTVDPLSDSFKIDLQRFLGVCRVVKGMRSARLGAIGARPNAFNTVRYSEKILQESGVSVSTIDLSEIFGNAQKMGNDDVKVKAKIEEITCYANCKAAPAESMILMAKLAIAITDWMDELELDGTAIQCWTSIQENYGVNSCALMSLMSDKLMPSGCEVDITGVLGMYALQLASQTPSALVDWNNNYSDDPNKCVLFHCGNWAKCFLPDMKMQASDILGSIIGDEKAYGAVSGRTPGGPMTFARISTDDNIGMIRAYVGEGQFTDDPLTSFGANAVVQIPGMQNLMHYICTQGFEHHVAMSSSNCAAILSEAFDKYLYWDVYHHQG
jgi:L-fucose isomerase-like protein